MCVTAAGEPAGGSRGACCAAVICGAGLVARLALCQATHALTASVDACRTLCELVSLLACLLATKYGEKGCSSSNRLYNSTYGLSRGTVLASLASRVLFASFSLALLVAALQAVAARSGHAGAPHAPRVLLAAGGALVLAALLRVALRCTLPRRAGPAAHSLLASAPADLISGVFVVSSAAAAVAGGSEVARIADPLLAAAACLLLVAFDCTELRAAGLVLLQASPQAALPAALRTTLHGVRGVHSLHELHAWQLTPSSNVATAHVVFNTQLDYMKSRAMVTEVFIKYGFAHVTIQPEFCTTATTTGVETDSASKEGWCAWGDVCAVGTTCGELRCCLPPIQTPLPKVVTRL